MLRSSNALLGRRDSFSGDTGLIVTRMYGNSVDETTRTLALEPFIDEVLRKLAGDGKVGFETRGGKKRWFMVPNAGEQRGNQGSRLQPSFVQASA